MPGSSLDKAAKTIAESRIIVTSATAILGLSALSILAPDPDHRVISLTIITLMIVLVVALWSVQAKSKRIDAEKKVHILEARSASRQLEELFAMTDMLQSANGYEDAGTVLATTANRLLPNFGGALYVFNNSQDRLDLIRSWNFPENISPSETLLPTTCWALKRGKPHINDAASNTLLCSHHLQEVASVEVPMVARGSLYGLLAFYYRGEDAFSHLMEVRRMGRALADSMSLALSNISLNERLKSQSLRDPLTGLYNRRYMEDALERIIHTAERSKSATSVVMIDLDNFKRLNDEHGHAKGDAVLRDVAQHLVGSLRPSDVVSRYGGEELVLILPETELDDAIAKSDLLRSGIERLEQSHGIPISASFGVASYPVSAVDYRQLIPIADEALYAAKHAGKNCVRAASQSCLNERSQPRLVVSGGDQA